MDTKNPLWQDIQSQSKNLRRVIQHLFDQEMGQLDKLAAFCQNEKPIMLVGIGSAAYLCEAAASYLNQHGRPTSVILASDAYYNAFPALRKSNIILNTRSGETVEIVKLCRKLKDEGIPYAVITNEPASSAAQLAKYVVWSNTRKDKLVSINVVTAMMTVTLVVAGAIMGKLDAMLPDLKCLPDALEESVVNSTNSATEIFEFFRGIRPIYLLYRGADKAGAYCGRLVLEEVARQPAIAMEAAEFRQGPIEVLDERFGAVVFVPRGDQGKLNLTLIENLATHDGKVMAVGDSKELTIQKALIFPTEALSNEFLSIPALPPVQVLSYMLAENQGYVPGDVRFISKIITAENGIPNQTRSREGFNQ